MVHSLSRHRKLSGHTTETTTRADHHPAAQTSSKPLHSVTAYVEPSKLGVVEFVEHAILDGLSITPGTGVKGSEQASSSEAA